MNFDNIKKCATSLFSSSFSEARGKFIREAAETRPYGCSHKGPGGEELFTDAAYFGPLNARNLLVLVSATHGPEGYCGSAAQLLFLKAEFQDSLPPSTAVLLIHALNCYGFAWDRRSTAEGCDLNRNFVDFTIPLPKNEAYEELADYFVPSDVSTDGFARAEQVLSQYRATFGETKFFEARMSGQYTRPGGLFYGGTGPTEARKTLEQICVDFNVAGRKRVIIIDYHTGQGRYGYGELMCEQPSGIPGYERAAAIFGPSATSPDLGTSTSVALHGTQDEFWQRTLGDRHTYVALEFGTYTNLSILRNEHWLFMHRPESIDAELGRKIRMATKLHYYPQRADWKEMVLSRAHLVHRQAVEALSL